MYRYLHCLAIIFVMAPAMVFGQNAPQPPTPPTPPCPAPAPVLAFVMQAAPQPSSQPAGTMAFDSEKRKVFEKTYKVGKNDVLHIESKYGRVHVNTWNKNEIQVKVDMIARANSDSKTSQMLSRMSVAESRSGNNIYFKTDYDPVRISGPSSSEINYTVYMPENNAINLKTTYGDVYLAALKGKVNLDMRYGNLKSDRLANPNNTLRLTYGKGNCSYINGSNLQAAYFDLNLAEAKGLKGNTKYTELTIGRLEDGLNLEMKYGSFKVHNINSNVKNINLASTYIPISLNFAENAAFNFDVNVQYAEFKATKEMVNMTSVEKDYTSAAYKGSLGNNSPKGAIIINSKYGDVRFQK